MNQRTEASSLAARVEFDDNHLTMSHVTSQTVRYKRQ